MSPFPPMQRFKRFWFQMAVDTWGSMSESMHIDGATSYEPSEKYAATDYVVVSADELWDIDLRELHEANNLPLDSNGLQAPNEVFCYFARMTDTQGRRLTALRRATQFKGILKSRLIQVLTDQLTAVEDKVFKLDADFDLLIDQDYTHVWRPTAFESLANLRFAILNAVPDNISKIATDLPFLNLDGVQAYAASRPRAARYLASISSSQELNGITADTLTSLCRRTGVKGGHGEWTNPHWQRQRDGST